MKRRLVALAWLAAAGCLMESGEQPGSAETGAPGEPATPAFGPPERFGFGTPATAARIALWDIDVRPDGEGLPSGSGSIAEGEHVYRTRCAACHGASGTEGPDDRLVATGGWDRWPDGRAIGNYWPYATTLFDYIRKAMPQMMPGTLSADDTYAVIAYLLHLNGIVGPDAVMDAETLPAVEMPARDRFVPDDRTGGPEVR